MPTYGQTESASAVNQQNRNEFQIDLGDLIFRSFISQHSAIRQKFRRQDPFAPSEERQKSSAFSAHFTHIEAYGMTFSRILGIRPPQISQVPYVPSSIRWRASSIL